jgi:putative transposase
VDQTGIVLDVLVQRRRDKQAAKRLLRKLLKKQGGWSRTALDVDPCVGGIANMDGRLTCNHGNRSYGGPGYGSSYGPQGGYGR